MSRFVSHFVLAALLALHASPPVWAHAMYDRANPAAGSEVKQPPRAATITFTEAVEPRFSTIEVRDKNGARVDEGGLYPGRDGRDLAVRLHTLGPGKYTVIWHVTSVDTHRTEGRYDFTIVP